MAQVKEKYRILRGFRLGVSSIEEREGIVKEFPQCPNEKFGFSNVAKGVVEVAHVRSGMIVCNGETMKQAEQKLLTLLKDPKMVEHAKTVQGLDDYIQEYQEKAYKVVKLREEFTEITDIVVPLDPILGGIDIIRLDKKINPPDGISLQDFITKKWGKRASKIVEELCDLI